MTITPAAKGIVTRSQWLAQPPKRPAVTMSTPARGVAVHHGATATPTDHAKCLSTWRGYQRYHLNHPTEDYSDIAYCVGFCTHGYVFIGRGDGWTTQGGANGTRPANRGYYSACFIGSGTAGFGPPAQAALLYIIDRFRDQGRAGLAVKPHRALVPAGTTACPSDPIAAFLRGYDGKPLPETTTTPPPKEPTMARYVIADPDNPGRIRVVPASTPGARPARDLDEADGNYLVGKLDRLSAKLTEVLDKLGAQENG